MISIWFFVGISLLVNGVLIFGAGLYEYWHPPSLEGRVQLFDLHASVVGSADDGDRSGVLLLLQAGTEESVRVQNGRAGFG